jgi:type III secretory pathway component EscS
MPYRNHNFTINHIKLIIITLLIILINSWQTSDILINFNQLLNITDFR